MKRTPLNNKRRCTACRKSFKPYAGWVKWCSPECQDVVVKIIAEKARKERVKQDKKDLQKLKEKHKGLANYMNVLQVVFNEFIRLRDKDEPCISCGTFGPVMWSAGHYYTVGSSGSVRFDEDNVHKQCWFNCNKNKSGNLAEYYPRLIAKIGQERFDALTERKNTIWKPTIPELIEKIEYYKEKVKQLKRK